MTRSSSGAGLLLGPAVSLLVGCSGTPTLPPDSGYVDAGACASRADCPSGEVCLVLPPDAGADAGGTAPLDGGYGSCTFCRTNGVCQPQELCDADGGLCIFRPGFGDQCTLNTDCPLGQTPQFCVQGLCVPQSQVTFCQRGHCNAGQRCNTQNNVCEEDLGCSGDQDCAATETCNPGTRQCEPRCDPLDAGLVCNPVQMCVGGRCVDCTDNSQCPIGLSCDTIAGRCTAPGVCYSDATCPAGLVCNVATSTCGPQAPPCTNSGSCPSGYICDITAGQCTPAQCEPDAFSPNQTQATAAPIQPEVSYTGLTLCGSTDQDWYSIPLISGDTIQVTINVEATGAGYSFAVSLFDGNGALVGAAGQPGALALNRTVNGTATYYLQMVDGDNQAFYGFLTQVAHGPPCTSTYDNQSIATALPLDGGVNAVILCPGVSDYYSTNYEGAALAATLSYGQGLYLGLNLLASDGLTILASADGGSGSDVAYLTGAADAGLIYVEVYGNGVDPASYGLGVSQ